MTPQGRAMLMEDEGCQLVAYPDPLSGGAPYTVGYGHTGPEVHPGYTVTQERAEADLDADIATAEAEIKRVFSWAPSLDPARLDVLTNMMFNLGPVRLAGFHNTLAAMRAGDWKATCDGMLNSAWAHQVKGRAYRLASIMQSGVYPT